MRESSRVSWRSGERPPGHRRGGRTPRL